MDYYKITNEEEIHNGLKYKTGLNTLKKGEEFNPSGDCEPGGIYFSREDILCFLNYGCYIRKVTLPEDAQVYENPRKPKKWKADKVILGRRQKITASVIKRLLKEGADQTASGSNVLSWAVKNGCSEIAKLVIPVSDPKAEGSYALRWAAENGHTEVVRLLLPVSDPKEDASYTLRWAARNGHTGVVRLLLPVSDPKAEGSYALRWAARNGHEDVVKLLDPVS